MKKLWENLFNYLSCAFPNWNPDQRIKAVWLMELREYQPSDVLNAVKAVIEKTNSQFVPNLFQVTGQLKKTLKPDADFNVEWLKVESLAKGKRTFKIEELCEQSKYAVQCLGGIDEIGYTPLDDLKWVKKDFLKLCETAKENNLKPRASLGKGFENLIESIDSKTLNVLTLQNLEITFKKASNDVE